MQSKQMPVNPSAKNKKENVGRWFFRVFSLCWVLTHWILAVYDSGYPDCFFYIVKYLTYWGMQLTILYFLLGVLFHSSFESIIECNQGAFSSLNQIVFVNNFMITLFYFSFLYQPGTLDLTQYLGLVNHSGPFVLVLLDTIWNNSVFTWGAYWKYLSLMLLYLPINVVFSIFDEPVYPNIDYKNWNSVFYILIAFLISLVGQSASILLKKKFKGIKEFQTEKELELKFRLDIPDTNSEQQAQTFEADNNV